MKKLWSELTDWALFPLYICYLIGFIGCAIVGREPLMLLFPLTTTLCVILPMGLMARNADAKSKLQRPTR